jgi:hypothetical protein
MNLPSNLFDGNVSVQTFLCQPDKEIIGEILPYDFNATFKFNTYSEISFTIDRYYNDLFDGATKVNPYYDLVESLRVIYIRGVGHFIIQDVDEGINENESKSVTCFSLEYNTGQKYLENFYVNTGEDASIEAMYNAQLYGVDYNPNDNPYSIVNVERDTFDPYQRYYIKQYSNDNGVSYNHVEQQVRDANHFATFTGGDSETTLYVRNYERVRFYWPTKPELSLLHNVFARIPEWKIGHVDKELQYQERTFSEDRTAVYDFLYNTAAETLKFVMVWDSINGVCNFYKTEEDGVTTDTYVKTNVYNPNFTYYSDTNGTVAEEQPKNEDDVINGVYYINVGDDIETQWDTDVFISRENLASQLDISYSTDDIKTKLKIAGADTLDVRDVNLGQNYILNLSYYNTPLWLGEDLHKKFNTYTNNLTQYTKQYKELVSARSAVYNEYNDLMNHVPVEPRVMLIGDTFDKLYCTYGKYKRTVTYESTKTYYTYDKGKYIEANPTKEEVENDENYYYVENIDAQLTNLRTKLELYNVDQDEDDTRSQIAKTDDVLLTLENGNSDSVTIRVRYNVKNTDDKPGKDQYYIYRTYTNASTGISNTTEHTIKDWLLGNLTAEKLGLVDSETKQPSFKIKSIGTLGAYFCLVRDETNKAELEDYGIRLLKEKQDTYTKIFITQTEGYMNEEGTQCVTSNEEPKGDEYPIGTKWLDTNNTDSEGKLIMKKRNDNGVWETYVPEDNDYKDYARFYENYTKLGNVQAILAEKQRQADYLLDGIPIRVMHLSNDNINLENLLRAAAMHFITLDNDCYVVKLGEELPNESIEEGAVCVVVDEKNLTISIQKYTGGAWKNYAPSVNIMLTDYNKDFGYITFKVDTDTENEYAAYVINGTPYVSYVRSQGLCLVKMNVIKDITDMNNPDNFTEQELVRLSPFIREDEYSDSNFLLTTYESEEEEMNIKQELLNAGDEELKKICQPKLSFSATMANILAIPEFAPLRGQFKLGNFVRVGIRDGYVKRARLLEVQINFDDPSDFSATFGDLMTTKSEIDKHADLLSTAVTAGKSVASNQSKWQRGADKATELDNAINDGLRDAALSIGAAEGQSISWDSGGIWGRKLVDGTTDQYEPEQFRLINNKLVFSSDGFKTSKAVFGKYTVNGETRWGPLAEYITAETIEGKFISGGSIRIGGNKPGDRQFIVHEDGSVEIGTVVKEGNDTKIQSEYVSQEALDKIDQAYKYRVELSYTGETIFNTADQECTVTCKVFDEKGEIALPSTAVFKWYLNGVELKDKTTSTIKITANDITGSTQLYCRVTFNE